MASQPRCERLCRVTNNGFVAIDQGTSSTKGVLLDSELRVLETVSIPVNLESPQAGWVQQNAAQLWESVRDALGTLQFKHPGMFADPAALPKLAITNQRESALAWDPKSGQPLSPMLGWQDRRTAERAEGMSAEQKARVRALTGLPLDPMFSALKFEWILNQIDPDRSRSKAGELCLGTVDSWLVFKLTGEFRVEAGNASRTQLLDLATGDWSPELLDLFGIPAAALPRVCASDEPTGPITTDLGAQNGTAQNCTTQNPTRITAVLADSHAALYAHLVSEGTSVKATFGTGSSIMALASRLTAQEPNGLVKTLAWRLGSDTTLALEGNILSSGSTVVWLGDLLGKSPNELAEAATRAQLNPDKPVNLVPAFGGLGAPWWDTKARARIDGITLATDVPTLARAAFEAIVLQIEDVLEATENAIGAELNSVSVDGGPTSNGWLMQLQADLSQRRVTVAQIPELSAYGVAALAAKNATASPATQTTVTTIDYLPAIPAEQATTRRDSWHRAIDATRGKANRN